MSHVLRTSLLIFINILLCAKRVKLDGGTPANLKALSAKSNQIQNDFKPLNTLQYIQNKNVTNLKDSTKKVVNNLLKPSGGVKSGVKANNINSTSTSSHRIPKSELNLRQNDDGDVDDSESDSNNVIDENDTQDEYAQDGINDDTDNDIYTNVTYSAGNLKWANITDDIEDNDTVDSGEYGGSTENDFDSGIDDDNNDESTDGVDVPDYGDIPSAEQPNIEDVADPNYKLDSPVMSEPGFDLTREEMRRLKVWRGGVIPYFIDDFSFDKVLRDKIRKFLEHTQLLTRLKFVELPQPPKSKKKRWVFFVNRRSALDCDDVTRRSLQNTGIQRIVLGYDCVNKPGAMAAMVLGLVGVPPQHNSPDRDLHISVDKANILPDKRIYFNKIPNCQWLYHELPYDTKSASHYPYNKYTSNGKATLKGIQDSVHVPEFGGSDGFSKDDLKKIDRLYNYIIYKKDKNRRLPACSKLFKQGQNFGAYKPFQEPVLMPRPKSSKFTGNDDHDESENDYPEYNGNEEYNDDLDFSGETDYVHDSNDGTDYVADSGSDANSVNDAGDEEDHVDDNDDEADSANDSGDGSNDVGDNGNESGTVDENVDDSDYLVHNDDGDDKADGSDYADDLGGETSVSQDVQDSGDIIGSDDPDLLNESEVSTDPDLPAGNTKLKSMFMGKSLIDIPDSDYDTDEIIKSKKRVQGNH